MADVKEDEISELREKDREHDSRLDSLTAQNQTQDFKLKSQIAKDKEHDFRLDSLVNKNGAQDAEIHRQAVKDEEHDIKFQNLEARCNAMEKQIRHLIKMLPEHVQLDEIPEENLKGKVSPAAIAALVCGVAALILSVVNLLV